MHASTIGLTGVWVVGTVAVLALIAVVLVPWRWDAWRRRRLGRSLSTLAAVVLVVLACALEVNALGSFYPTLGTVIGTSTDPSEGTQAEGGPNGEFLTSDAALASSRAAAGHGTTVHSVVHGPRSGLDRDVDVYLPAAYSDPALAGARFPVIEWFPGFPGQPRELAALFGVPDLLDAAIAAHRIAPVVVIMPDINDEPRMIRDEECVDAVGGAQDDTFLSTDVHDWAQQKLRVRPERTAWALTGWSTGGYCALDLSLRHPQWYATAASLSGYDRTADDVTTGDLFKGNEDVRRANDVTAMLRDHPSPIAFLLAAGVGEVDEQAAVKRMSDAAVAPEQVATLSYPGGGHNEPAVKAELPGVLDWLGQHLPSPLAPPAGPASSDVVSTGAWPLPPTSATAG